MTIASRQCSLLCYVQIHIRDSKSVFIGIDTCWRFYPTPETVSCLRDTAKILAEKKRLLGKLQDEYFRHSLINRNIYNHILRLYILARIWLVQIEIADFEQHAINLVENNMWSMFKETQPYSFHVRRTHNRFIPADKQLLQELIPRIRNNPFEIMMFSGFIEDHNSRCIS